MQVKTDSLVRKFESIWNAKKKRRILQVCMVSRTMNIDEDIIIP